MRRGITKLVMLAAIAAVMVFGTHPAHATAGDACSSALPVGSASGCGVIITVTAVDNFGNATAVTVSTPVNGNPYDASEDTLVGIVNSSGSNLSAIILTSPDQTFGGVFNFDGDGPCAYAANFSPGNGSTADCFHYPAGVSPFNDPYDYQGPNNTFTIPAGTACGDSTCFLTGTVNFITAIPNGGSTWFALEGPPSSIQTVTLNTLTVNLLNSGNGSVSDGLGSSGLGTCYEEGGVVYQNGVAQTSGACMAGYPGGTVVHLTATANDPTASSPTSTFGDTTVTPQIAGWGGACATSGTDNGTTGTCSVTMNSTQNVSASFDIPQQTQQGTVTTGTQTSFNQNGGIQNIENGGSDYTAQLTSGSSVTAAVTQITFANQDACSNIFLSTSLTGAKCFVMQNGQNAVPTAYELLCPNYPDPTDGTCGSSAYQTFLATLGTDFSFLTSNNPGLDTPGTEPNQTLTYNEGSPLVGFIKFVGNDALHPCTVDLHNPTFLQAPVNQISVFNFVDGTPTAKPVKGPSSGTGSCWVPTYATPNEAPSATITNAVAITGGSPYPQNGPGPTANYTCNAVNNTYVNSGSAGPFLTVSECNGQAVDISDNVISQGNPGVASYSSSATLPTSTLGANMFSVQVTDSAQNVSSSAPVTYYVQGSQTITFPAIPPQTYGGMYTLNASAPGGQPNYTLLSGPATLAGSVLTFTGVGPGNVEAYQGGGNNYGPAPSVTQPFTVSPASTSTALGAMPPSSTYAQPVTFTATVTGAGTVTGSVTWSANTGCGTTTITPGTGSGAATCITSALPAGSTPVTATYIPDSNHTASGPTALNYSVGLAGTITGVVSSTGASPSIYGSPVMFTATVTAPGGGVLAGSVAWTGATCSPTTMATPVASLVATCTTSALAAGIDTIKATYTPDSNHTGSFGMLNQVVDQGASITSLNHASFTLGVAAVPFTVTTSGYPATPMTISYSGTLPAGVTFTNNGNGTATIAGTPTVGGSFPIMITASNGVGAAAVQTFTLTTSGALLTITPNAFNFGTVDLDFALDLPIMTVKNVGNVTANITNVSLVLGAGDKPNDYFTIFNSCGSTLAPGKTCTIAVVFFAGNVGTVSATLNIANSGPLAQATFTAQVINPLASLNPNNVNFGTVKVGHNSTQNVTLSNPGTTALAINTVSITGANVSDFAPSNGCPSSLPAGGHCTIGVTFTPSATGKRSASLTVNDNAPLGTQAVLLTGKGN